MRSRLLPVVAVLVSLGTVSSACSPAEPAEPTPTKIPRVLIFGDSYTEGYGAATTSGGYAYRVGDPLDWDVRVDGVGSTGYVNPGNRRQGTYLARLAREKPATFDLVVLQGSSNDSAVATTTLSAAVAETVTAVRARYPSARLLMMGPCALYGSASPGQNAVDRVLSSYARQHAIAFIDPIAESWFRPGEATARYANPQNAHPNDDGYARIADLFVRDVRLLPGLPTGAR